MKTVEESKCNLISEGTLIEGEITFDHVTRVHGMLKGEVHAKEGSTLILSETGVIEGKVKADHLMIDGFIRGNIQAKSKVKISSTGRVIGNIITPALEIEFGAHFEGRCVMEEMVPATESPALSVV